jgi:hypothetical protein
MQNATLLTYGTESPPQVQPYVLFDFVPTNLQHLDLDARVYPSPPSRQVFVLRYARNGADNYATFRASLEKNLRLRGWSVLDIGPEDLEALPGGCTLIIPTGYLPAFLLGDEQNQTSSLIDLASRGIVVVYMGLPFDQNVLGDSGVFFAPTPALVTRTGISFETARPLPSNGLRLNQPLYRASWREGAASLLWGSISQLTVGPGFLLMVPENLDGGWPGNGATAGEDMARLVAEEPYRPVLSQASWSSSGELNSPVRVALFAPPMAPASGVLRLRFILNDTNGLVEQLVTDWPIYKNALGDLYFENPVLLPTALGGSPQPLRASLRESSPQPVKLYFELIGNGTVVERQPLENGLTQPTGQKPSTLGTDQPPGEYVLRLADENERTYAATHLQVTGLSILYPRANSAPYIAQFQNGEFNFSFQINGQAAHVPYVRVQMQSPGAPVQEFRDTDMVNYRWSRDYPRGNYTVLFDFGNGYRQSATLSRVLLRNFWERPEIIVMALVAIAVFSIAFWLRAPAKALYSLDIPDFPPKSVTKIPMPISRVIALFAQINKDYAWERMPLRPEEVKNGFRKILHEGKPVVIGDYNLSRLLQTLQERKLLVTSLGYWAPTSWIAESGESMDRLAMFRSLRDLFVTGAVRFSRLGALPNCDVKILIGSNEYYLHFYLGDPAVIGRALQTIRLGRTWIIFRDAVERDLFEEHLHSASPAALSLKMQIYEKRARLFTLDDIVGVLKRLKVDTI